MDTRHGVLGWALAHALARLCGGSFGFLALWTFVRLFGDGRTPGLALLELGLMVLAGLIQGALLGLLAGQVLVRLLPDADFEVFVRNTTLLVGLEHLIATLPIAFAGPDGSASMNLVYWSHTLAGIGFALTLGPVQWFALRRYPRAGRYVVASILAQLAGMLLDWLVQLLVPSFELSLPSLALRLAWMFVQGGLVALPTGWVLVRLARS